MGAVNTLADRQALPDGKGAGRISRNRQSWLGTAGPSDCGYARWFRVCAWFAVGCDQSMVELLAFPAGLLSTGISPWENFWLVVDGGIVELYKLESQAPLCQDCPTNSGTREREKSNSKTFIFQGL